MDRLVFSWQVTKYYLKRFSEVCSDHFGFLGWGAESAQAVINSPIKPITIKFFNNDMITPKAITIFNPIPSAVHGAKNSLGKTNGNSEVPLKHSLISIQTSKTVFTHV